MIVVATLEIDQPRAAFIVSVLTNRADLGFVKVRDLVLKPRLDLVQLAQLEDGQVFLDLVSLCPVRLL